MKIDIQYSNIYTDTTFFSYSHAMPLIHTSLPYLAYTHYTTRTNTIHDRESVLFQITLFPFVLKYNKESVVSVLSVTVFSDVHH